MFEILRIYMEGGVEVPKAFLKACVSRKLSKIVEEEGKDGVKEGRSFEI